MVWRAKRRLVKGAWVVCKHHNRSIQLSHSTTRVSNFKLKVKDVRKCKNLKNSPHFRKNNLTTKLQTTKWPPAIWNRCHRDGLCFLGALLPGVQTSWRTAKLEACVQTLSTAAFGVKHSVVVQDHGSLIYDSPGAWRPVVGLCF